MEFEEFFGSDLHVIDLRAEDRWEAINELLADGVTTGQIRPEHRESIKAEVVKREAAMSTGIGFGIAIPHASTNLVSKIVTIVGRSRKGIPFEALDQKLVQLVFLFLVPRGELVKHVDVLANIAKTVHGPAFRQYLKRRFGDDF
jgi:mannitol/fructose-specific phosphotransferase system IIA component (Ntr-type)